MRGRGGDKIIGQPGVGEIPAKKTLVTVGVPDCRWVKAEDINDEGMMAAWQKPSAQDPNGCIELDETHPVIRSQIEHWQSQYPPAVGKQMEKLVKDAYEEVAVAKVSHLHALTGSVFSEERRNEMLQNPTLTTSLLGSSARTPSLRRAPASSEPSAARPTRRRSKLGPRLSRRRPRRPPCLWLGKAGFQRQHVAGLRLPGARRGTWFRPRTARWRRPQATPAEPALLINLEPDSAVAGV